MRPSIREVKADDRLSTARLERHPRGEAVKGSPRKLRRIDSPLSSLAGLDFDQCMVMLLPDLQRFARKLTRHPADAADLVQDTCLRAVQKFHLFVVGSIDGFRLWLRTIMRNLHCTNLRRRRPEMPEQAIEEFADPRSEIAPAWRTIEDDQLMAAVGALPPCLHRPYILYAVDGLSYSAIASSLRIPQSTVGTRIYRARSRLRVALGRDMSDDASCARPRETRPVAAHHGARRAPLCLAAS